MGGLNLAMLYFGHTVRNLCFFCKYFLQIGKDETNILMHLEFSNPNTRSIQ